MAIRLATIAVATVLGLILVPSAEARSSFCSPSGDWCTSVGRGGDARKLSLASFAFDGAYRVCVRPPGDEELCKAFRLRRTNGVWASRVTWRHHFPARRTGTHRVRFISARVGGQLGPTLTFRR